MVNGDGEAGVEMLTLFFIQVLFVLRFPSFSLALFLATIVYIDDE